MYGFRAIKTLEKMEDSVFDRLLLDQHFQGDMSEVEGVACLGKGGVFC